MSDADDLLRIGNGIVSVVLLLSCVFVILHRDIHEGCIIKIGLSIMALSLFASVSYVFVQPPASVSGYLNASIALRTGMLLVVVGYVLRTRARKMRGLESTDWSDLTELKR